MSGYIAVKDLHRACLAAASSKQLKQKISQQFTGAQLFLEYNRLGFFTGVDRNTWSCEFLLSLSGAEQLVDELEEKWERSLDNVRQVNLAASQHNWAKYDSIQSVNISNQEMYKSITKSFKKLARQRKTQAYYSECQLMLEDANQMAQPVSPQTQLHKQEADCTCATMFISLDFETWEKSHDYMLEVGYSLWDNVTRRHRTRHWVIKENLNKCNGRHVNDNRMSFLFGTSKKGSLDAAMDALQMEVDELGLTEGLSRQEQVTLRKAGLKLVLVGHGMDQDLEQVEGEIEWPANMPIMDTQKLYLAYQLKHLDAAAAPKALQQAMARRDRNSNAAQPLLEHGNDLGLESDTDEYDQEVLGKVKEETDDTDDNALSDLEAGLADCAVSGSKGNKKTKADVDVDVSGLVLVKTKQPQLPQKVRPWPAGPLPEDPNRPTAPADDSSPDEEEKLDHQIGLSGLLAALNIKGSKLHNAGNDARFTMEAFLALCGHPACADPVQAHINSLTADVRYQEELEKSLKAAAAQGWGTSVSQDRANTPDRKDGSTVSGKSYAGAASRPGSGAPSGPSTGNSSLHETRRPASAAASCGNGSAASSGGLSPPPGFAARCQIPLGSHVLSRGNKAWQNHVASAADAGPAIDDADDYPRGFAPISKSSAPAPKSWAAMAGDGSTKANAWGRGPAAAAAGPQRGQSAWGKAPTRTTTATASPWGGNAAKGPSSASGEGAKKPAPAVAAAAGGGSAWGPASSRQTGFAAHNSSVDTGFLPVKYEPNPDAF